MNKQQNEQLKKFKEAAKELECDESEKALDKAFKQIEPKTEQPRKKKSKK